MGQHDSRHARISCRPSLMGAISFVSHVNIGLLRYSRADARHVLATLCLLVVAAAGTKSTGHDGPTRIGFCQGSATVSPRARLGRRLV